MVKVGGEIQRELSFWYKGKKLEETEDYIEVALKRRKLDKDHEVDKEKTLRY